MFDDVKLFTFFAHPIQISTEHFKSAFMFLIACRIDFGGASQLHKGVLLYTKKERITENIFKPLLENNKTVKEESSDDEEAMIKKEKWHRTVDGGKMPPKTVKEIQGILNTKYTFNSFNILIYAQNNILKVASETDPEITSLDNRD